MKARPAWAFVLLVVGLGGCAESREPAHMFASADTTDDGPYPVDVICSQNKTVGIADVIMRNDGPGQAYDIAVRFQSDNESMPAEDLGEVVTIPVDAVRRLDVFVDLREGCGPEGTSETFRGTFTVDPANGPPTTASGTWICVWGRWGNETAEESRGNLHC
jgi:hypothetical protein